MKVFSSHLSFALTNDMVFLVIFCFFLFKLDFFTKYIFTIPDKMKPARELSNCVDCKIDYL